MPIYLKTDGTALNTTTQAHGNRAETDRNPGNDQPPYTPGPCGMHDPWRILDVVPRCGP